MATVYRRPRTIVILILLVIAATSLAQVPAGSQIQGIVLSNKVPLPGVVVVALNSQTLTLTTTSTDVNGQYSLKVPATGKYQVSAELAAFASEKKDLEISDLSKPARVDFELILLSRSQRVAARPPAVPANTQPGESAPADPAAADPLATDQTAALLTPQGLGLPGMSADAPTESVAISGNTASPAFGGMFDADRLTQMGLAGDFGGERGFGAFNELGGQRGGPGGGADGIGGRGGPGGPGGPGGGRGGFGGPGGPGGPGGGRGGRGGFALGGQRGRGNTNRPNINVGYTLGSSAFDAAPYSLKGEPAAKPQYTQSRFNATIGGPLVIPKVINSPSTNYNVTYNGSLVRNPFDSFSTVPTLAERSGDFSQRAIQLINPKTGVAFAGNQIPSSLIDPAAAGLLRYIPEPNLPGTVQNLHYVTTNQNNGNDVNVRINHTFAAPVQPGQRGAGRGGAAGGRGGRGGGGAGPRGGGRGGRSSISFGIQYRTQNNTSNNAFPTLGGTSTTRGLNLPVNYSRSFGRVSSNTNFSYNRNRTSANNLFSNQQDIAGTLGILGVSKDPLDWGLPTLSFTNYSSLNDVRPSLRLNQTYSISESLGWFRGKHNVRFGGDFRRSELSSHTGTNARGTFTFNGTSSNYDLADFLLGLPQLTSVQYGSNTYRFRGSSYNFFVQDDWRLHGRVTLNLGLRYEFTAPMTEADNRLVNLDAAPDFSAVAPVVAGESGPFTGVFSNGLINPDRNNWAPQIGLAWRAMNRTIVRAGYGVSYNSGVYNSMVQQFAFQPPFSVTQTNIASPSLFLTLQNGFPTPPASTVTNNFGVDKNYRVGYAQTWNLSVQRELPKGLTMSLDYTGTKGTRLDILQAPNRTATGLRIASVQPFTWESSTGNSIAHVGRLQLRRRLQYGISVGGNYTWSKAIDNASSFGAGAGSVAQDAMNLGAERALSSFDQPHRFNGDYLWQLPFGQNKRWLAGDGLARRLLGDWQLNGTWSIASSTPFTARVIGDSSDIRRGTNGTLRANATGLPVALDDPGVALWFNTAAFAVPAAGTFGNAARNTIRGPSTHQFDMSLNKSFSINERNLDLRVQASNVFNIPQYRSIDTTVNSPSFGRVTSAGSMRKIQLIARYRF